VKWSLEPSCFEVYALLCVVTKMVGPTIPVQLGDLKKKYVFIILIIRIQQLNN